MREHFLGRRPEPATLFGGSPRRIEPVKLYPNKIRMERSRQFGDVWLAWQLWSVLGLDQFCERHLSQGGESVPWPVLASILVIARFCNRSSELEIAERWYPTSALEDLLGVREDQVNPSRLYRGLDRLLPHKEALEKHLRDRLGRLFDLDYDLLRCDVTSTYFEGEALRNPKAPRGYCQRTRYLRS